MSEPITAAGAVLWRPGADELEICVIHRPKHDDWSLPKGKVDDGEHVLTAAVREVHEETGHRVTLGRPLPAVQYRVNGRPKVVHFWAAHAENGSRTWTAISEVDKVTFKPASKALKRLTYDDERAAVQAFLADDRPTTPLVLLRHTSALGRGKWSGDDALRPLTSSGRAAAKALAAPLAALGVARVISSDATRCADTAAPIAKRLGVGVDIDRTISEDGFKPKAAARLVRDLVADDVPTVVCSHRPVLPELLAAVAEHAECVVPADPLPAGGFHVLHIADNVIIAAESHPE